LKHAASRALYPLLLALIEGSFACTPLDDPDDVYEDDDLTLEIGQQLPARSNAPIDEAQPSADPWSCIPGPRPILPPPEERPETVTYTVSIVDWLTQEPLTGLTIKICNRIDALCSQPLATLTPAPGRQISFPLPARFEVYLTLETADHVPAIYYFDGPVVEDRVGGLIQLLQPTTVGELAQQFLATQLDLSMGVLAFRSYDCNGAIAAGAVFEMEPNMGVPYTLINNSPTRSMIPTDTSGIAGYANVPPGAFLARGFVADTDREFGIANFSVQALRFSIVEVRAIN